MLEAVARLTHDRRAERQTAMEFGSPSVSEWQAGTHAIFVVLEPTVVEEVSTGTFTSGGSRQQLRTQTLHHREGDR